MQHMIKALLGQKKSQREIARQLGVHRDVVRRLIKEMETGQPPGQYRRPNKMDGYEPVVKGYLEQGLSAQLIWQRLCQGQGLKVSYPTVRRFVFKLKGQECFVPMHCEAGEEAQVDFGYLGRFVLPDGSTVKVWGFCMVLSYSRYAYFEVVLDQSLLTFLICHRRAFESFNGVPATLRLDNLKAGVTTPDFYEPLLQEQYAEFLAHYGCVALPCRVRTPEHKGKVESGIKYLKGNFVLGLEGRQWEGLPAQLRRWQDEVCNRRRHGTTHQVPAEVFRQCEQAALMPLPTAPYELYRWEERKVNRLGHVTFLQNYYSVPYQLVGAQLRLKSNEQLLRIYHGQEEVAVHPLAQGKGSYQTREEHKPPYKQQRGEEHYREQLRAIGPAAVAFMEALLQQDTHHWKDKVRGILHLSRKWDAALLDKACQLAVDNQLLSYKSVCSICENLQKQTAPQEPYIIAGLGGFCHDLSLYDELGNASPSWTTTKT